jgi:hypothetical protein
VRPQDFDFSQLFTSEELAVHIVDTLADHGLIDKARFNEAVAAVKWELDAQHGIGRIVVKSSSVVGERGVSAP